MCNPFQTNWGSDTKHWGCFQSCLTPPHCSGQNHNGSGWHGGVMCFCERANKTVGRESRGWNHGHGVGGLPPQCGYDMQRLVSRCVDGTLQQAVSAKLGGAKAVEELLCEACGVEPSCTGWTVDSLTTGRTFSNKTALKNATKTASCISAVRTRSRYGPSGGGPNWYSVVDSMGGHWYSTPTAGMCVAGAPLGTGGCTWRSVKPPHRL